MMMLMWKHKYKHVQCGTQWIASFGGVRAANIQNNEKSIIVHSLIVKPCDFGHKSSSLFFLSSFFAVAKLARDIFVNCVCARACTVYTNTLRKSIDEQINSQPNETNWASGKKRYGTDLIWKHYTHRWWSSNQQKLHVILIKPLNDRH